jgi:ABC-type iron transport system FetAB ATPase subunit
LQNHAALNAAHNSLERESEQASVCLENTREEILNRISKWSENRADYPICWLQGPAGSGKSTIAHTIAQQCAHNGKLAFSFFFSRGKPSRSDTTKFFATFAYQLAQSFPVVQASMRQVLLRNPSIVSQRLHNQMKDLIIYPLLAIQGRIR